MCSLRGAFSQLNADFSVGQRFGFAAVIAHQKTKIVVNAVGIGADRTPGGENGDILPDRQTAGAVVFQIRPAFRVGVEIPKAVQELSDQPVFASGQLCSRTDPAMD